MIDSEQREDSEPLLRSDSPDGSIRLGSQTTKQPSARQLRRQLLRLRRKHDAVVQSYQNLGTSYSEPMSSLMYSLASDLGRDDNDLLWHAIVGVSSMELSGRTTKGVGLSTSTSGSSSSWNRDRGEQIRAILRDEVRRLNPTDIRDIERERNIGDSAGIIQTHAKGPTDFSIRLSPEPRLLLVRHWSLYESMLHSPFLSPRLRIWQDAGKKRMDKLLAKMGISLAQSKQQYRFMDMELKRGLRERLLKFAPVYGLEGLVPMQVRGGGGKEGWGFVRCWGFGACLSAVDVGVIVGAILEVGDMNPKIHADAEAPFRIHSGGRDSGIGTPVDREDSAIGIQVEAQTEQEQREEAISKRFWTAYDSLQKISLLQTHVKTAQHLHRAILSTGTALIEKKQIRLLRAFRLAVVREGPDVQLFTHPGALIKLALWLAEAITEQEGSKGKKGGELVLAGLDETRGIYVVVGLGGGAGVVAQREKEQRRAERRKEREKKREVRKLKKEKKKLLQRERMEANGEIWDSDLDSEDSDESESDLSSDDEEEEEEGGKKERGKGLNRFGIAFSEAVDDTGARVRQDSFEHSVVEVKKEDLSGFLESLSMKAVVG